jgi:two-component system sensor histidine kinase/response regulator
METIEKTGWPDVESNTRPDPLEYSMTDAPREWNPTNALARVEGDDTLLRELIGLFLDDYPKTIQDLQKAIIQIDARSLERHAHTLKGSASNFEALPVVTAGQQLESSGYLNDWTQVPHQMQELEAALARLRVALQTFLNG